MGRPLGVEGRGAYANEVAVQLEGDVHGLGDKDKFATGRTPSLTSRRCRSGVTYVDLMCSWMVQYQDQDERWTSRVGVLVGECRQLRALLRVL